MNTVNAYLVGGAVRDILRGKSSKDYDFAVEADSFSAMREWLEGEGFEVYVETPKYFTIRARAPKGAFSFGGMDLSNKTFDFTLCRTEKDYTDGRRPDSVEVGTLYDDLSRRDFTMNAIAIDKDGKIIDPFGGAEDITNRTIRCVGSTDRLKEDGLRIFRAIRFKLQTGFRFDDELDKFLLRFSTAQYVEHISLDRVRDELTKCFQVSSVELVVAYLFHYGHLFVKAYDQGLWLKPTSEQR